MAYKRVLVCGGRNWTNRAAIKRELTNLLPDLEVVIHGAAPGADLLAEDVAKELQIDYMGFPAKWKQHHKAAGPIRNRHQLKIGKPDLVLGFHSNIAESKGTKDMLNCAKKQGIETRLITV